MEEKIAAMKRIVDHISILPVWTDQLSLLLATMTTEEIAKLADRMDSLFGKPESHV